MLGFIASTWQREKFVDKRFRQGSPFSDATPSVGKINLFEIHHFTSENFWTNIVIKKINFGFPYKDYHVFLN